ncbi:MAG: ATP-binding protein [Caulobacteraceae bacterium]
MYTDDKRLQQIIKNLLSNAFKFTESGGVSLSVRKAVSGWNPINDHLNNAGQVLVFSVKDSGIGIPEDKQRLIFEAFQQADGTTSRKYGGTGLGLSISREITRMLGGELTVKSVSGEGSTFSLYLPLNFSPAAPATQPARSPVAAPVFRVSASTASVEAMEAVQDDRDEIERDDSVVLIVEDDPRFAAILLSLVREGGFKGVVTGEGDGGAVPGPPLPAQRHHAGRGPAGHGRPRPARHAQAHARDAAYPGACDLGRRPGRPWAFRSEPTASPPSPSSGSRWFRPWTT